MNKTMITCLLVLVQAAVYAQVGIGTTTPHASAAVEIAATDKGLLIPQMTAAQRIAIANPATGLLVIQTDTAAGFYYNAGTPISPNWINLSAYTLQQNINTNGKFISGDGSNTGIQVSAGGLLQATGPYTSLNTNRQVKSGSSLFWAPHKAAFRAGYIDGNQWDDVNVGRWSAAMGINTQASGYAAMAFGQVARASGNFSVAMGSYVSTNGFTGSFMLGDAGSYGPYSNTDANQMLMRFAKGYHLFTGAGISALSIDHTGKVGIGETTPTEKLDVDGNITYSGTLNMGIQIVSKDVSINGNRVGDFNCGCPSGTKLIGGGGGHRDWNNAVADIEIAYSGPHPENFNFWRLMVHNTSGSSRALRLYVICAKVK